MDYGLIGERLGHSYSKTIHERIADYDYELLPLDKEAFDRFMSERSFRAINVTIPYKKAVLPYLDEMDAKAEAIGAVNAIVNRDGKLIGYNTDYDGFLYTLNRHAIDVGGKKAVVLGNGGAAMAVLAVLGDLHVGEVKVVNVKASERVITREDCHRHHADAHLVVNTSPVGMFPKVDASPFDGSPLSLSEFHQCEAFIDLIYNPIETKLARQAAELQITAITGLEMLVAQAVRAVELFLGRVIDNELIDVVYNELLLTERN